MSDVLTINSATVNLAATNTTLDMLVPYAKGGIPELHFTRLLGPLATLPDPWRGQSCSLTMLSGTGVFSGDVGATWTYMQPYGWIREYRAGAAQPGQLHPGDRLDHPHRHVLVQRAGRRPQFHRARAGMTVGAIVAAVLNMPANATALAAAGIGNYTSAGPPPSGLPSVTTTDLAGLTIIPQWRVTIAGERILSRLEAFVQSCHPNHFLHVDPRGNIRFLDSGRSPAIRSRWAQTLG